MPICDRRLYLDTYATFEAHCRERWGWSRSYLAGQRSRRVDDQTLANIARLSRSIFASGRTCTAPVLFVSNDSGNT